MADENVKKIVVIKREGKMRKTRLSAEDLVKMRREEKRIERVRQLIVEFGDVFLAFYLLVTSAVIAYMSVVLLYIGHRNTFLEALTFNNGSLIGDFFLTGFLCAIAWFIVGAFSIWMYKSQLELKRAGYKKRAGLFTRAMYLDKKKKE